MVMISLMGRDFDVAPYMLGDMLAAAPYVDAQQARQRAIEERAGVQFLPDDQPEARAIKFQEITRAMTFSEMMQNMADAVRIIHIGVAKLDPTVTPEAIMATIRPDADGFRVLVDASRAVLDNSGLKAGEAKPAP